VKTISRTRHGLVLASIAGLVAGATACIGVEPDDDPTLDSVEQRADTDPPKTKCFEYSRDKGADMWDIDGFDTPIDRWLICYTVKKGTISYGDGPNDKCDTTEVTVSIRAFVKKDGKYIVVFTNHPGTTITMPMCKDAPKWEQLVKLLGALGKIDVKWTEIKLGLPPKDGEADTRQRWKPGDPGADDFMRDLISVILKNMRKVKPTKTFERKAKDSTTDVPDKMSYDEFSQLDDFPLGVAQIEVTGDDVAPCLPAGDGEADGPTPVPAAADALPAFAGADVATADLVAIADCSGDVDPEIGVHTRVSDVITTIDDAYLGVAELTLDALADLEAAAADGTLAEIYALLNVIDPTAFLDEAAADAEAL
jgi:hypothetical protein